MEFECLAHRKNQIEFLSQFARDCGLYWVGSNRCGTTPNRYDVVKITIHPESINRETDNMARVKLYRDQKLVHKFYFDTTRPAAKLAVYWKSLSPSHRTKLKPAL